MLKVARLGCIRVIASCPAAADSTATLVVCFGAAVIALGSSCKVHLVATLNFGGAGGISIQVRRVVMVFSNPGVVDEGIRQLYQPLKPLHGANSVAVSHEGVGLAHAQHGKEHAASVGPGLDGKLDCVVAKACSIEQVNRIEVPAVQVMHDWLGASVGCAHHLIVNELTAVTLDLLTRQRGSTASYQ